jgi:hypothetical protein
MDTQSIIALIIVAAAGVWAAKMLIVPLIAACRPQKPGRCAGGCGCGHEDKNTIPESGKADACATPGPEYRKTKV